MNNCEVQSINNAFIERGLNPPLESGPLDHLRLLSLTAHFGGTVNFSAQCPIASADVAAVPTGDRSYPHRRQIYPRREKEGRKAVGPPCNAR